MASYDIILDKNGINCRTHDNTSATADHVKTTGHNIKWDHFDILVKGKTDYDCKIKETLFIQKLEPAFNVKGGSEKLILKGTQSPGTHAH